MNKIIKTQEEMIQELAIMYATSLVRYGVDIQGKLESATQISLALNEAYCRGRVDEREYMTRSWKSEVAENE